MFAPTRRRVGALVLVAALGAAVVATTPAGETLADFADREFASGTFTGSKWNLQGSTDYTGSGDATWSDHYQQPATLTVSPTTIDPWTKAYAPFSLRLEPGSAFDAEVSPQAGQVTATPAAASSFYKVRMVRLMVPGRCNEDAFNRSNPFILGAWDRTVPPNAGFNVQTLTLPREGTPTSLCTEFSVDNNPAANGSQVSVTWSFNAVSKSRQ